MQRRCRGFTLIEQLAVVSIAGTVSVTALPALVDFHSHAEATALASLAAAAGSAMLLNQAGCMVSGQRPVPDKCTAVHNCAQVSALLLAELPAGYRVPARPLLGSDSCQLLRDSDGASARFYGAATTR